MDIGFETIIYIVLGLIFVLAQVAKKKKKDAAAQMADNEDSEVEDRPTGTSILEQLLGIPEQKPVENKPVDNNISPERELNPSFRQPSLESKGVASVNEEVKTKLNSGKKIQTVYNKGKSAKRSVFNLRTAVIYKALLERKNY